MISAFIYGTIANITLWLLSGFIRDSNTTYTERLLDNRYLLGFGFIGTVIGVGILLANQ